MGKISFQLTPMNTLIEGELSDVLEVVQVIHELPFDKGLSRVYYDTPVLMTDETNLEK